MPLTRIPPPAPGEYPDYYDDWHYLEGVPGGDALAALAGQVDGTVRVLGALDEARALHRYAPGKWSVKEVVQHLADAERMMSMRALRAARGEEAALPPFDGERWVRESGADARPLADLLAEFRAVRAATLAFYRALDAEHLLRRANASGYTSSVRALAWAIAGHERHHLGVLRERYGVGG